MRPGARRRRRVLPELDDDALAALSTAEILAMHRRVHQHTAARSGWSHRDRCVTAELHARCLDVGGLSRLRLDSCPRWVSDLCWVETPTGRRRHRRTWVAFLGWLVAAFRAEWAGLRIDYCTAAAELGVGRATFGRMVVELEARGYISKVRDYSPPDAAWAVGERKRVNAANIYQLGPALLDRWHALVEGLDGDGLPTAARSTWAARACRKAARDSRRARELQLRAGQSSPAAGCPASSSAPAGQPASSPAAPRQVAPASPEQAPRLALVAPAPAEPTSTAGAPVSLPASPKGRPVPRLAPASSTPPRTRRAGRADGQRRRVSKSQIGPTTRPAARPELKLGLGPGRDAPQGGGPVAPSGTPAGSQGRPLCSSAPPTAAGSPLRGSSGTRPAPAGHGNAPAGIDTRPGGLQATAARGAAGAPEPAPDSDDLRGEAFAAAWSSAAPGRAWLAPMTRGTLVVDDKCPASSSAVAGQSPSSPAVPRHDVEAVGLARVVAAGGQVPGFLRGAPPAELRRYGLPADPADDCPGCSGTGKQKGAPLAGAPPCRSCDGRGRR